MEKIKPLQSFKMNRKIPIKTKTEAIEYSKKIKMHQQLKIKVATKSIRRCKLNETIFKSIDNTNNTNKKIILHSHILIEYLILNQKNHYMTNLILIGHWEIQLLLGLLSLKY